MLLKDPRNIADFLKRYSIEEYRPAEFLYEWTRLYDVQNVPLAAAAVAGIEHFNTATSARGAHARGLAGCNLTIAGRLPGNTSFIVTGIELQPHGITTDALVSDVQAFAEYGWIDGIYVKQAPRIGPVMAGCALVNRGAMPILTGVASAATTVKGAAGRERGYALSPESFVTIANGEEFKVPVGFNGSANLSAPLALRVSLVGLKIEAKGSR